MFIFGFVSHWHYPVGILASCPFVCNFRFGLYSDPFQYDLKKHRSCTGDKRNCSVICTQFKIIFLGKWDECGERPFLWPLTSYPDRHTYSVHSAHTVFHPALNSSSGTSLGSVALRLAVRRMARAIEWSGVFAALTSCPILFPSSSCYMSSQYPCAASGWNFRVIDLTIWKSCLEFPFEFDRCFQFHAHALQFQPGILLFILFELTLHISFSSWYRFLSLPFASLFSLIVAKVWSLDIHFFFFCDFTDLLVSLVTFNRTVLVGYLSRDLLVLPQPHPMP